MKLTKDGKTLFTALCERFVNIKGHRLNKRLIGKHTTLLADRNENGEIRTITMRFYNTDVLTINTDNYVLVDVKSYFTQTTMNRCNKLLNLIGLNIGKKNGEWTIADAQGQLAQFQNAERINLSRPHGSALYQIEEKV